MRRIGWLTTLVTICLAAFALRVFRLDFQSLWYDEAFSVYLAHFDLATITARTAADIQPPLYYYLLHFWIALAGDREFAIRFFSLIFGVATIPLLFVLARRLFTPTLALPRFTGEGTIAAILATISPLYIWYSQEARMYTLITFLLLLSSYALVRSLRPSPQPSPYKGEGAGWLVFVSANIAATYTHYFAFVVITFQFLFVIYVLHFTRRALRFMFYFALILAAFLPWLPFVIARFGQDVSYWRGALKLDEALRHILINFTMGESVLENIAQSIAAGWLVILLIGLITLIITNHKSPITNHSLVFLILYLVIPLVLLLFLFSRNPKFNARYLMIASPAFFILLAAGLAHLSRIKNYVWRFALFLLPFSFLSFTSLYSAANAYFDPAFTKASFREVAQYIQAHSAPDEAIILTSGHLFPAFDYYYHGDAPQVRLPDDPTLNTDHVIGYAVTRELNQTIAGKRGVWVVEWQNEVVDPNGFVPMLLSSRGVEQKVADTNFYQVRLRHWTLQPNARWSPQPEPQFAREANFQNDIQLIGFTPTPMPADAGVSFNLFWQSLDTFSEDYQIALRVRDAAGNLWGKQDRRPAGYNYPTTRWKKDENLFGAYTVPLLAGAPAGDYFVDVTFYAPGKESGLDVLAPNGAPMGKSVKLGPLPVLPATKPATLAALSIQNTLSQPIGPFTLLGYQLGRVQASAGETIPLTLFWRADAQPSKDYSVRVAFGEALSDVMPLANLKFPTSTWRAGEIVQSQLQIAVPANATTGATNLSLALVDDKKLVIGNLVLAPFTIEKTDRVFVQPAMPFEQSANFANAIALIGYQVPITLRSSDVLQLTLYWQARAQIGKAYTVFVHLLDSNNKVIAQKDAQPLNGARPTTGWVENEFIVDPYELRIDAPPGNYRIEIGWYDASDFSRLQVLDATGTAIGDHAILKTSVEVK